MIDRLRIAVLYTCHNRRDMTLASLDSLKTQENVDDVSLEVFLVDDGSADGTGEAVLRNYPDVNVLSGDGNLYWGGGLRAAFAEASKGDYDFYLWLNDDVRLFPHAIRSLLDTSRLLKEQEGHEIIVAGSTKDPVTGRYTYGGRRVPKRWPPFKSVPVIPSQRPLPCDTMNGNIVLVPREIGRKMGCVNEHFKHSQGDIDYGLQATIHGYSCWIAPNYLGTCDRNSIRGSVRDINLTMEERLKKMSDPTEVTPIKEKLLFVYRNTGYLWPLHWILIILSRRCFPRLWIFWLGRQKTI